MTMANGAEQGVVVAVPAWRRFVNNVVTALTVLVRPPRLRPAKRWLWPTKRLIVAAVATVVLFVLAMVALDAVGSTAASKLPRGLIDFFNAITDYGKSGWFLWPLGVLFLALAALPPLLPRASQMVVAALMVRVGFLFAAIAVPGLFVTIIKRLIGRARPFVTGSADPFVYHVLSWRADYASLPSGHSTTAFSVLVAFGTLWPRLRPLLWFYALMIAASRVIVTAHYPTDVAAGAITGVVGALLVRRYFALRRLGFSIGSDGNPKPFAGPSWARIKSIARGLFAP